LSEGARFLHPLLTKTLETSRTFEALAQSYSLLLDLFDKLDFAVAFCDSTNRLLVANAHLRALATERIGLYIGNDVVEGETVEVSARIRACICAALQGESEPSRLCTTLPRKDGGSPLLLRAAPMRERQVSRDSSVALVVVLDPENESRISVDGLAAFNLLSPAELDVCRLLVRVIPTGEIAEHRSTGLETTRSQIKSAQAKLGCTSRLDLLRLALVTTAPFKDNGFPPSGG
jgi:DNA-binding CsgD family transcriptional regulator